MMMSFYALSECNYFVSAVLKLSLFCSSPEMFLSLHFVLVFFISPSQDVSLLQFRGVCVSNEFSNPLFILSSIEGCLNPQQQDGIQKVIISSDCTNSSKLSLSIIFTFLFRSFFQGLRASDVLMFSFQALVIWVVIYVRVHICVVKLLIGLPPTHV